MIDNCHSVKPRSLRYLKELRPTKISHKALRVETITSDNNKSASQASTVDSNRRIKGPPAEGLIKLKELRKQQLLNARRGVVESDTSGSEYVPDSSKDGSNDSDSSYYSDGEVISDRDGNAVKLCPSFSNANDEWSAVGRPHKDFGYTEDTSNCAQVVSQSPIEIYNLFLTDDKKQILIDAKLWHFDDNSTDIQHDRLHKIRRILELLVNNFQIAKQPPENVVIDETMVPFRGQTVTRSGSK